MPRRNPDESKYHGTVKESILKQVDITLSKNQAPIVNYCTVIAIAVLTKLIIVKTIKQFLGFLSIFNGLSCRVQCPNYTL